jgi:hypothetical protein
MAMSGYFRLGDARIVWRQARASPKHQTEIKR